MQGTPANRQTHNTAPAAVVAMLRASLRLLGAVLIFRAGPGGGHTSAEGVGMT
jgi:hypothetical protein